MLTLFATALGSALAFLDTTVVIVALPQMEEDLGLGLSGQQWVYLAYALSLSAFYLVGGAVGDRVGLRRTFIVGVILFALASLLTALAPSEGVLIGGRALQGVGGAVLTTTSLALLRVTWAGEAGRAIGLWTSLTSLATVGGPPLGGVIVQTISWRWVFLINVPLAAVTVVLALAGRGDDRETHGRSTLDLVGSGLVAVGLVGITYALVEVREQGLEEVLPFLIVGAAALGRPRHLDAEGARPGRAAVAPARAGARPREPRHARHVRGARRAPALPAGLPAVPRLLADARGPRLRAAEHRVDPARAAVRPLRRPQRPETADRRRRGDDRRRRPPAAARHRPGRRLDVGGGERLPLRARAVGRGGADHGGGAVARAGGSRRRCCRDSTRRSRESAASSRWRRSVLSPARCSSITAESVTPRSIRQPKAPFVRPASAAFHGVIISVAALAFLASVHGLDDASAATVRAERPRA